MVPSARRSAIAEITKSLNLDKPGLEQIGSYLKGLVVGRDLELGGTVRHCGAPCLGYSFPTGQPVTKILLTALPVTLSIVVGGAIIYSVVGLLTGTIAARYRSSTLDRVAVGTSLIVNSVPYFVVALLVALYLTRGFLPRPNWVPLSHNPVAWATGLLAAWLTLGLTNAALYTRYSRASMIESLGQDFVRTARSKGISERRVVYRHARPRRADPGRHDPRSGHRVPVRQHALHREHLRPARAGRHDAARVRPVRPAGAVG